MESRIKEIRKKNRLTQKEFGERIGIKACTITSYEKGMRVPSETVVMAICREFNVCREWLETGNGVVEVDSQDNVIDRVASLYSTSKIFRAFLEVYARLGDGDRESVDYFIEQLAEAFARGKDPASVYPQQDELTEDTKTAEHRDSTAD